MSEAAVCLLRNLLILLLRSCSLQILWRRDHGLFLHLKTLLTYQPAKAYFLCRSAVHLLKELTLWLQMCAPLCRAAFEEGWGDLQLFTAEGKLDLQRGLAERTTNALARNTCLCGVEGLKVFVFFSIFFFLSCKFQTFKENQENGWFK